MKNVPGVTVDADGNAQLRNQSPNIFIDGRPTTLTLQQISADQIDRVEVITNPSAKYDANSTGGILNVIMKTNIKPGYNGMIMAFVGTGDRYGGTANINIKKKAINTSLMYSYTQDLIYNDGFTNRTQLDTSTKNSQGYFNQNTIEKAFKPRSMLKFGIDYTINNRNTISLNENIVHGAYNIVDMQNYTSQSSIKLLSIDGYRLNDRKVNFNNYTTQLLYKKTFPKAGKAFTCDVSYNYNKANTQYLFSTYAPIINGIKQDTSNYQKNDGGLIYNQFVFQADYVNPISEFSKIEFGIRSFYKKTRSFNNTYNATYNQENYKRDDALSNRYVIDDMINAAYVNYSSKTFWDIAYQGGLRFEQSNYKGDITDKNLSFSYSYPSSSSTILNSLFPAIYFSKKLKKNQEVQVNFSRKIQRPNFFQMLPFVMYADKQNIRMGNPELKPEFKNISEINYNKIFKTGSYLCSGYFRYEEQPITDILYASPTDPSILIQTTVNGKNSIRYGIENTLKVTLLKNLEATINANVFYLYLNGTVEKNKPDVTVEGYAYNAKSTLLYKFPKNINFQINGNYESSKVVLLGYQKPIYFMDLSLNYTLASKWIFSALLSDVFNTKRMGTHYDTPYYIQDMSRRRETRFFRFNISYIFGKTDLNFKKNKSTKGSGQDGGQDGF